MNTQVFLLRKEANTDHCSDCLGEEHETCSELFTYLVVETNETTGLSTFSEDALCEECAKDLMSNYHIEVYW